MTGTDRASELPTAITLVQRPDVDRFEVLPSALALGQQPPVPGRRSTRE